MRRWFSWVLMGMLVGGCDTNDGPGDETVEDEYLDADAVMSIPQGDAVGDGFSGSYEARAVVVSCTGACEPFQAGGTTYEVCERDAEFTEWVTAYQDDGALRVDLDDDGHIGINVDGYVPVRLHGGIDADGRWEVGGYDTKFESLESTARARGIFREGEPLEGTLELRTFGVVEGTEVDCHATHRLTAPDTTE